MKKLKNDTSQQIKLLEKKFKEDYDAEEKKLDEEIKDYNIKNNKIKTEIKAKDTEFDKKKEN